MTHNGEAHFKVDVEIAYKFRDAVRRKYKGRAHGMMQLEVEKALLYYKKKVLDDYFESGLEKKPVEVDKIDATNRANSTAATGTE